VPERRYWATYGYSRLESPTGGRIPETMQVTAIEGDDAVVVTGMPFALEPIEAEWLACRLKEAARGQSPGATAERS
jgi:hypothetical protein